jgi:hypothetical protein
MAAVIYHKLNAIVEGRLIIEKVKISSIQGDNIWIHFDSDFAADFSSLDSEFYTAAKETPWWFRPDPSVSDWFEPNKKDNELKFHYHKSSWEKALQWENTEKKKDKSKSSWNPRVINGGKETKH